MNIDSKVSSSKNSTNDEEIDNILVVIQDMIDKQADLAADLRRDAIDTKDIILTVYLISCLLCAVRIFLHGNVLSQTLKWEHVYCLMVISAVIQICSNHKQNATKMRIIPT